MTTENENENESNNDKQLMKKKVTKTLDNDLFFGTKICTKVLIVNVNRLECIENVSTIKSFVEKN